MKIYTLMNYLVFVKDNEIVCEVVGNHNTYVDRLLIKLKYGDYKYIEQARACAYVGHYDDNIYFKVYKNDDYDEYNFYVYSDKYN